MSDKAPDNRKFYEKWPTRGLVLLACGAMYVLGTVNELIEKATKKK